MMAAAGDSMKVSDLRPEFFGILLLAEATREARSRIQLLEDDGGQAWRHWMRGVPPK